MCAAGGDAGRCSHRGKQCGRASKSYTQMTMGPSNRTSGCAHRRSKSRGSGRYPQSHVQAAFVTTGRRVPPWKTDKQNVFRPYNGILLSLKRGQIPPRPATRATLGDITLKNVSQIQRRNTVHSTSVNYLQQSHSDRERDGGGQGPGEESGGQGSLWDGERFLPGDGGDGHTTL